MERSATFDGRQTDAIRADPTSQYRKLTPKK
jgi:hypothetical protein